MTEQKPIAEFETLTAAEFAREEARHDLVAALTRIEASLGRAEARAKAGAGEIGAGPALEVLEVAYDLAAIPESFGHPFDFQKAALAVMERALTQAGAGDWAAAERRDDPAAGAPMLCLSFETDDPLTAEAILRDAVADTPYDGFRVLPSAA